jgi:hypothetical protein
MAIRYAKEAMTIDGIVFNPGDIVPESLYPALDAHEANMKAAPVAVSNQSFPAENADDEEEEDEDDDDEETYEIEVPLGGSEADLPSPEVDSTSPAPEAPKADAKGGKKAGK